MPIESEAQAIEALAQAAIEDGTAPSEVMEMDRLVREARESAAAGKPDEVTSPEESFTKFNRDDLPEEIRARYDEMSADYTRKTQELAAERKAYAQLDEFGGIDAARQAVEFASALANDPNYALQVHANLTEALTKAGLTPAQAAQEATQQIDAAIDAGFEEDYFGDSPVIKQLNEQLSTTQNELSELKAWRQQQEQIAIQNRIQLQENKILQANPDWKEENINDVYKLAYSTGGDLEKAAEVYKGMRNAFLEDYIASKASVSSPSGNASGPGGDATVGEDVKFEGLFDPRLSALVNERLARELAAENN